MLLSFFLFTVLFCNNFCQYHKTNLNNGYTFLQRTIYGNIQWQICEKKKNQYGLEMADGSLKIVNEKIIQLPILIQQHHEIFIFDVFGLAAHNVILNIFWLKTHNLIINWKNGIFTFQRVGNITNTEFIRR